MSYIVELHIDNPVQTNKSKPAENEVPEEVPQDPLIKVSQTTNETQDIIEREEEVILAINEPEVI